MTRAEMTEAQLDVAQAAARAAALAAGALQRQHLGAPATHKGEVDLVTAIDLESERIIRAALTAATPEVPILAEEGGGRVSETELGPLNLDKPRILASNRRVHEALAALLAPHLDDPR